MGTCTKCVPSTVLHSAWAHLDAVLLSASSGKLEDPAHMLLAVRIKLLRGPLLAPMDQVHILYTVRWRPVGCTPIGEQVQGTEGCFEAGVHALAVKAAAASGQSGSQQCWWREARREQPLQPTGSQEQTQLCTARRQHTPGAGEPHSHAQHGCTAAALDSDCSPHQKSSRSPTPVTPGGLSQSAKGKLGLWREQPERALEAGCVARQDDSSMALQALCAPVDDGLDGGHVWCPILVIFCSTRISGPEG